MGQNSSGLGASLQGRRMCADSAQSADESGKIEQWVKNIPGQSFLPHIRFTLCDQYERFLFSVSSSEDTPASPSSHQFMEQMNNNVDKMNLLMSNRTNGEREGGKSVCVCEREREREREREKEREYEVDVSGSDSPSSETGYLKTSLLQVWSVILNSTNPPPPPPSKSDSETKRDWQRISNRLGPRTYAY